MRTLAFMSLSCITLCTLLAPRLGYGQYASNEIGLIGHVRELHASVDALVTLDGPAGGINDLVFSANEEFLACAVGRYMSPGKVVVWNRKWQRQFESDAFRNEIQWIKFSPDSRFLAATSLIDPLRLYATESGDERMSVAAVTRVHTNPSLATFSRDSKCLLIPHLLDHVEKWNLSTFKREGLLHGKVDSNYYCVDVSPDGKLLAAGGNNSFTVWDLTRGQVIDFEQCKGAVRHLAFSPSGQRLVTLGSWADTIGGKSAIGIWDVESQSCIRKLQFESEVASFALIPGSDELVFKKQSEIYIVPLGSQEDPTLLVPSPQPPGQSILCDFAVSVSGKQLSTMVAPSGDVTIWDIDRRLPLAILRGHAITRLGWGYPSAALAFSPEGSFLAVGSDESVTIWDTKAFLQE